MLGSLTSRATAQHDLPAEDSRPGAPSPATAWKSTEALLRGRVEALIDGYLVSRPDGGHPRTARFAEAVRYALQGGGKRIRPLLVLASSAAASSARGQRSPAVPADAEPAALAVELIHTYSLIHDDLPALDNDDLRRGRPTLHRVYGEATALLVGDALLTDAFHVVARSPANAARQVTELARAAGSGGMVAGQFFDVVGAAADLDALTWVHERKTGALIEASCALGALAVDGADETVQRLRRYAHHFGLAFQIADDAIDVESGRGRDAANHKTTFATILGVDGARARAREEGKSAARIARELSSSLLVELALVAATRSR